MSFYSLSSMQYFLFKLNFFNCTFLPFMMLLGFSSCKHEPVKSREVLIFDAISDNKGFKWYMNNDTILRSASASAHNAWFRVRYNGIAYAALSDAGRLPQNNAFPSGSLVVKELFDEQNGALKLIAVMEKNPTSSTASSGWNWIEYKPDGTVFYGLKEKGNGCVSCHSDADRDLNRVFDLH
jgi:hypothetical protein